MLSYEDIIGLCELTEDEVRAIAEHERMPEIVAAELGNYLVTSDAGAPMIRDILIDDLREAEARGDREAALKYKAILKHFLDAHPDSGNAG